MTQQLALKKAWQVARHSQPSSDGVT